MWAVTERHTGESHNLQSIRSIIDPLQLCSACLWDFSQGFSGSTFGNPGRKARNHSVVQAAITRAVRIGIGTLCVAPVDYGGLVHGIVSVAESFDFGVL